MVGLQALDLLDRLCEAHCQVEHYVFGLLAKEGGGEKRTGPDSSATGTTATALTDIALISSGGKAGQVSDVFSGGLRPVEDDHEGKQQASERIEPPDLTIVANCIDEIGGKYKVTRLVIERGKN